MGREGRRRDNVCGAQYKKSGLKKRKSRGRGSYRLLRDVPLHALPKAAFDRLVDLILRAKPRGEDDD